jgi:hypothetical protein
LLCEATIRLGGGRVPAKKIASVIKWLQVREAVCSLSQFAGEGISQTSQREMIDCMKSDTTGLSRTDSLATLSSLLAAATSHTVIQVRPCLPPVLCAGPVLVASGTLSHTHAHAHSYLEELTPRPTHAHATHTHARLSPSACGPSACVWSPARCLRPPWPPPRPWPPHGSLAACHRRPVCVCVCVRDEDTQPPTATCLSITTPSWCVQ